jgi:hypothetical protein
VRVSAAVACSLLVAALVLQLWHGLLPRWGDAVYQFGGGPLQSAPMPIDVPSEGGDLRLHTTLTVGAAHPVLFSVTPDDCLEELSVDGQRVPFEHPLCLEHGGTVWLGGRLHRGDNSIDMRIKDHGGRGGVSLGVSIVDPIFLAACTLAASIVALPAWLLLRRSRFRGLAPSLLGIAVAALAVRLPLIGSPGYLGDLRLNAHWAKSAVLLGLGRSYLEQVNEPTLPNYPPLQLAVFEMAGRAYRWLLSPNYDVGLHDCAAFMKLPAVAADAATCIVLFFLVRKLDARRWVPLGVALLYAIQPAAWYESAVWGQVDAIFALAALLSLAAALSKRWVLMGAFIAVSLLTKLQSVVVVPAIAVLCILERGAFKRTALAVVVTCVATLALLRSASVLHAVKDVYVHSSGYFPVQSMFAYNVWIALFGSAARDKADTGLMFGLASYRLIGTAVFVGCTLVLSLWGYLRLRKASSDQERAVVILGLPALTAYSFFLFNTEMHERYAFLLLPLGLPAVVAAHRCFREYVLASVLMFVNLLGALPWTAVDRTLFKELPNLPAVVGTFNVLVFLAMSRLLAPTRPRHHVVVSYTHETAVTNVVSVPSSTISRT